MHVIFSNPGLAEIDALLTLGVSAKEGDNAFGRFGTGFKYAVATLLRHGQEVELQVGHKVYTFGTVPASIRGKQFDIITLNGQRLSITTQFGRDWELWMAYRELYCNAMDEHGKVWASSVRPRPNPTPQNPIDETTRVIVKGSNFHDVHTSRDQFILQSAPVHKDAYVCVHPGPSNFVFYQGLRVHTLHKPTLFTYNLGGRLDLTEDRTAKFSFQVMDQIDAAMRDCCDAGLLEKFFTAPEDFYEHEVALAPSVIEDREAIRNVLIALEEKSPRRLSRGARSSLKEWREKAEQDSKLYRPIPLTKSEQAALNRALDILECAGHNVRDYTIVTTDAMPNNQHGCVSDGVVYIDKQVFSIGDREVINTVLEEHIHLTTGHKDCTRAFQTHALRLYVDLLVETLA